ncbi:hypothetical protein S245_013134 [Arachis hypogaea]
MEASDGSNTTRRENNVVASAENDSRWMLFIAMLVGVVGRGHQRRRWLELWDVDGNGDLAVNGDKKGADSKRERERRDEESPYCKLHSTFFDPNKKLARFYFTWKRNIIDEAVCGGE